MKLKTFIHPSRLNHLYLYKFYGRQNGKYSYLCIKELVELALLLSTKRITCSRKKIRRK